MLRGHDGSEEEQLPVLWKRSLPHEAEAQWDFSRFIPEVVVLQIGAQDLATGRPPRRLYRAVLELWIQEIRARYPEAWILLTPSPTVTEQWPKGGWGPAWLQDRVSEQQRLAESRGDSRVRTFALSPVEGPWGEDYQPSAASQATLAREAVVVIRDFTGW